MSILKTFCADKLTMKEIVMLDLNLVIKISSIVGPNPNKSSII